MMRLPPFDYRSPGSTEEAVEILAGEGPRAMVLAGGTDLLPNMKRRHQAPEVVVALRGIEELHGTRRDAGLRLGSLTTLADIAADREIAEGWSALHRAAAQVATPHLRNAATIGGNVLLDTRCTYYDQNAEWRESIDFCMKAEGTTCWVAPGSPKCLAVSSTDCAPALLALDAEIELAGPDGRRRLPLSDLYKNDGIFYSKRRADEVLTEAFVPDRSGWRSTYWKLRRRGSIDFPVLGVAAAWRASRTGVVEEARLVLGAVASRPVFAEKAVEPLVGSEPTDEVIAAVAEAAAKLAKPMDNADFTLHWRKAVAKPFVAGVLRQLRGDDPAGFSPLLRRAATAVPGA